MNRIYQGRGSSVQMLKPFGEGLKAPRSHGSKPEDWTACPDGEELLWRHHAVFHDAVNYYLVRLLACVTRVDNPLHAIRERIASDDSEYQIWKTFRRRGANRIGLRDSVAKYLTPDNPSPTFDEVMRAARQGAENPELLDAAVCELLAKCDGEGAIQQEGRSMLPRFCDPDYKGGFPIDEAAGIRESGEAALKGRLHDISDEADLCEFASQLQLDWVVNLNRDSIFSGEDARERLLKAVDHFRQLWLAGVATTKMGDRVSAFLKSAPDALETLNALREKIVSAPVNTLPAIPANRKSIPDRLEAAVLFKFFPGQFTADLLRVSFPRPKEPRQKRAQASETHKPKVWDRFKQEVASRFPGGLSDDPIKLARGNRGYIFPAFTSLPCWNPGNTPGPQWKEFDIAAFKYALTAFNQIKEKGAERRDERWRKQARLDYMRGDGKKSYKPSGENDEAPARIAGDPRIERLETILESLRESHWMTEGETADYGLQPRTIRGFRELRRLWRKTAGRSPYSDAIRDRLKKDLSAYQTDNSTVIGSVSLFEKLLERGSWIVWQEPAPETLEAWAEAGYGEDPLETLMEERQLREDIERLKRPVRLTPADPEYSRRQYDFNAVSKFGEGGTCRHVPGRLAFTTEIAVQREGVWRIERVCVNYSAPRFLRDGLRADGPENLSEARWMQPMMEALNPAPVLPQNLTGCAVCLMPDTSPSGQRRLLLNFPVTLAPDALQTQLGRLDKWQGQLYGGKDEFLALRWPEDEWTDADENKRWYRKLDEFKVLSVDLGQRDAGAFSMLHCTKGKAAKKIHRKLGDADGAPWFASVVETGMFRLPGEDATVLRNGHWQEELYGERGRMASPEEIEQARELCRTLNLDPAFWIDGSFRKQSFPEINDLLLGALRRAQSQLARLQSWSWRCADASTAEECRKEIIENTDDPDGLKTYAAKDTPAETLQTKIKDACHARRQRIAEALVAIADCVLPLRGRRWAWIRREGDAGNHVLAQTDPGTDTKAKKLAGQRGLSMERLEQLEELRRRCLSLNRSLQQAPGVRAAMGRATQGMELPDPCPDILDKIDRMREQRVDQIAHMILARALGLKLRMPEKERNERRHRDIHGEYARFREPVDFIVLEDLSRYLSSQGRARAENSRLMQWCHRQILEKLRQLAETYGLKILQTGAAYSSRFCSRTGVAGFRAIELNPCDREQYPWKKMLAKLASHESGEKVIADKDSLEECLAVRKLFAMIDGANRDLLAKPSLRPKWRTLLAPIAGGPIFVPMRGEPAQADVNAAINLGLRATASPVNDEVHLRIRTRRENGALAVRTDSKREKTRWKKGIPKLHAAASGAPADADRSPNLFADFGGVADFDRARIEGITTPFSLGRGLWGTIKRKAWTRVNQINEKRIAKWGADNNDDVPM